MIFFEICEIFKITFFYRTPPVAASEERIAEEVRNFPCIYDKGSRAAKKKIGKITHDLGWRMPAATRKLERQFRLFGKMY